MIKVSYNDPRFQSHGYWNHNHHIVFEAGVWSGTTVPRIELYKVSLFQNIQSTAGNGGKPRSIGLFWKVVGQGQSMHAGAWGLLREWIEGRDYDDSSASASLAIHPTTGDLHVLLSYGKPGTCFQEWEEQINRAGFAPAIVPGGGHAPAGAAVPIPPAGALAALYTGVYAPTDFDTPQEIALRSQKQLDAIQEQTDLLVLAGVLTR